VARLTPGEYKRIPVNWPEPVGWYLACPVCKTIAVLLAEKYGWCENERTLVELQPWRCVKCKAELAIVGGRFVRHS
jgi:hypothetical protein